MRARLILVSSVAAMAVAFGAWPAHAVCRAQTEAEAVARADVVFEGVSQPGNLRDDGTLATPARFSVLQFLKGSGPRVVTVTDARGVDPMRVLSGEYWIIYGKLLPDGVVGTSPCYGSYLGNGPKPFVAAATGSPSVTPTASPSIIVGPPFVASGELGWGAKAAAGIAGLAMVIAVGYVTARLVIGTGQPDE